MSIWSSSSSLLADAVGRFGIEIHAYCLMTNHFHLVVHCPIGGLSRAMQSVERRYTQSYNERYRRDGPLFRGRFHSVDITTNEQLARLTRYVHRNPLAFVSHRVAGGLSVVELRRLPRAAPTRRHG